MLKRDMMESVTTEVPSDFQINNRWIAENFEELMKHYTNQWVAVLNKAVVDQDADIKKLVARLKTHHSNVYSQIAVDHISKELASEETYFIF
jgi:hypothetical protein